MKDAEKLEQETEREKNEENTEMRDEDCNWLIVLLRYSLNEVKNEKCKTCHCHESFHDHHDNLCNFHDLADYLESRH